MLITAKGIRFDLLRSSDVTLDPSEHSTSNQLHSSVAFNQSVLSSQSSPFMLLLENSTKTSVCDCGSDGCIFCFQCFQIDLAKSIKRIQGIQACDVRENRCHPLPLSSRIFTSIASVDGTSCNKARSTIYFCSRRAYCCLSDYLLSFKVMISFK